MNHKLSLRQPLNGCPANPPGPALPYPPSAPGDVPEPRWSH
ncbi:hypothetical protein [Ralstonia syzygii]|nr:hypothetical protein [Ralstonia syzygii]